jgi:ribosome biogenesis GTPase A
MTRTRGQNVTPTLRLLLSQLHGGGEGGDLVKSRTIAGFLSTSSFTLSERSRVTESQQVQTRLYATSRRKQQQQKEAVFSPRRRDGADIAARADTENDDDDLRDSTDYYRRPMVQWYPGHIAKAERQLKETFLKAVDVVVEVRDARAAQATSHPNVPLWCGNNQKQQQQQTTTPTNTSNNNSNQINGKPRLVVLTHVDEIPTASLRAWKNAYETHGMDLHHQPHESSSSSASSSSASGSSIEQTKKKDQQRVFFVNAKVGAGIHGLVRAIVREGAPVQERRHRRGLLGRPLRVGVIGYPNVGKSALLNRLILQGGGGSGSGSTGRRTQRAKTENKPGVTRSLQWIRVRTDRTSASGSSSSRPAHEQLTDGSITSTSTSSTSKDFELLDSPGIIPASLSNQSDAALLAACNCIGDAAYDNQLIAAFFCDWMLQLQRSGQASLAAPAWATQCQKRYRLNVITGEPVIGASSSTTTRTTDMNGEEIVQEQHDGQLNEQEILTGEDMLHHVAQETCQGDLEDAARKILQDFRSGRMGPICLQPPTTFRTSVGSNSSSAIKNQRQGIGSSTSSRSTAARSLALLELERRQERAKLAMDTARQRGLELPPMMRMKNQHEPETSGTAPAATRVTKTTSGDENDDDGDKKENPKSTATTSSTEVGKGLFDGW